MKLRHLILQLIFLLIAHYQTGAQANHADCATARVVCDKSSLRLSGLSGPGQVLDGLQGSCFDPNASETNSYWLKWQIAGKGKLGFTLLPFDEADDIDFALFRLRDFEQCGSWELLRCSAAGPNLGGQNQGDDYKGCVGATGLRDNAPRITQGEGCPKDDLNFLKSLETAPGEVYALFINNYRSNGDILVEWEGNCTFNNLNKYCISTSPEIIAADRDKDSGGGSELAPNPSGSKIVVRTHAFEAGPCEQQIISSGGALLSSQNLTLTKGENHFTHNIEAFPNGVYFLKIKTSKNTEILRFVKN